MWVLQITGASTQQGCAMWVSMSFAPSGHRCKALLALSEYSSQNNQVFVVGPGPWPSLQDAFSKPRTKRQSLPQRIYNLKHQYPVVKAIIRGRQGSVPFKAGLHFLEIASSEYDEIV